MLLLEQQIDRYLDINIETRYPDWDDATAYQHGNTVFDTYYYYTSVIDNNLNNQPKDKDRLWLKMEASNRYAQVDTQALTESICDVDTIIGGVAPFNLITVFQNARYDTIAFGNVNGSSVLVEMLDSGDQVVWSETKSLGRTRLDVVDWYTYYFTPIPDADATTEEEVIFRLPSYDDQYKIRTTIYENNSSSSCSYMICGQAKYLGDSLYGYSSGLDDFSYKEVDDMGVLDLKRRQSRQLADIDFIYKSGNIRHVMRLIREHLGKVILIVADEDENSKYEHLMTLGLIENYTTILSNSQYIEGSLSVSEVI